ncbi:MAG: hypothetical protein WA021_05765 [Minisyncoccia bacterium]
MNKDNNKQNQQRRDGMPQTDQAREEQMATQNAGSSDSGASDRGFGGNERSDQ